MVERDIADDSDDDEPVRRRRRTNFNKTNEKGETQLHRACIEGSLKSVEVLIKQVSQWVTILRDTCITEGGKMITE